MMRPFIAVFGAVILFAAVSRAGESSIPILAWYGPPANQAKSERFRELAEAGFTHNFSGFGSVPAMLSALDTAHAEGLKCFISVPELQSAPEETASKFKDHPANAGYYLRDEPNAADFPALAAWAQRIRSVDSTHPCYINLFPNYANGGQLGTKTYGEYLEQFVRIVSPEFVSFDHYPVVGKSLRGEWYENLEQVATVARSNNKPFWAFVLAVAHGPYPIATIEHLRLQAFSDLAYGAQGIQYFTYWTPTSKEWDFHEGPVDTQGNRTAVYERVKQVNGEIRALSDVFSAAKVLTVGHTGVLPRGTTRYEPKFPVREFKADGGALVSTLEKGHRRTLAVVNRDFTAPLNVEIAFDQRVNVLEVKKDGATAAVQGEVQTRKIPPGDIVIFTWDAAEKPAN